ncbi:MAG TPA: 4-(cytidine 5'-diphospho)-2-C-methyl-D-erythritol kinase, partial [Candidatus Sulfotelmatobacter sp.]|nr:4-(cytidine 5'-diphospho)-2-C-methyl-D-erythritol kinase [Candidatus Sulfotelmatobacter sp.]
MTVTVRSFAKINLGLRIGAAREDGFHELLTIYQTIALHDVIQVGVERGQGIEIRCTDPRVPKDDSNTCFRIVEKAMEALRKEGRVVVEIEKRLPVQGGMGGASANAVATLIGLERALGRCLSPAEKLRIAAEVGSDLPLFLIGGTVLGVGRGEQVYPLEDLPAMACVVVTPEVGVSTPKAFAAWDQMCGVNSCGRGTPAREGLEGHLSSQQPAELRSARTGESARPHTSERLRTSERSRRKLTVSTPSDRMNELGCGLSAWLGEPYSGAPSRRGRAENHILALVRAGIKNDFEEVVFPEHPELSDGKRA